LKLGIVDTTFARVDMAKYAVEEITSRFADVKIVGRTVPGIKDLPVACKNLLDECDACLAIGMPGPKPIDKQCAHEASTGLIQAQLMAGKHIVEVFVHEDEGSDEKELFSICVDRVRKHAVNAVMLVKDPASFSKNAGKGLRQGKKDAGPITGGVHYG